MKQSTKDGFRLFCRVVFAISFGVAAFAVLVFTSIVAGNNAVEIIKALAWPATVLTVVLLLLEPLTSKILDIARFRHKDIEIEFGKKLSKAEKEADALPEIQPDVFDSEAREFAIGVEPHVEVIGFWIEIERQIRAIARSRGIITKGESILKVLKEVEKREILDRKTLNLIHDLRSLRNLAAHSESDDVISRDQAARYQELSWKVLDTLRGVKS